MRNPSSLSQQQQVRQISISYLSLIFCYLPSQSILFEFNAQHDCQKARCSSTGRRIVIQERVESNITEQFIEHKPLDEYLINTHAFHNAHLIREILPHNLTVPIAFRADRHAHHTQIAVDLRNTRDEKRAATALKAVERRQKAATANEKKRKRGEELNEPADDAGDQGETSEGMLSRL
jgi:hypothetical protein